MHFKNKNFSFLKVLTFIVLSMHVCTYVRIIDCIIECMYNRYVYKHVCLPNLPESRKANTNHPFRKMGTKI